MTRKKKDDLLFEGIFVGIITIGAYITFCVSPEQRESMLKTVTNVSYILFFFGIFTVICATLLGFYVAKLKRNNQPLPFFLQNLPTFNRKQKRRKTKEFLSPSETEFKRYLEQNLPDNIEIHCKVRLADILASETSYRRIIMMHVDFVLFDKTTQQVVLAIELDDQSHNTPKARQRDEIKNNALKESEVKYVRVPDDKKYNPVIINNIVKFCKQKTP